MEETKSERCSTSRTAESGITGEVPSNAFILATRKQPRYNNVVLLEIILLLTLNFVKLVRFVPPKEDRTPPAWEPLLCALRKAREWSTLEYQRDVLNLPVVHPLPVATSSTLFGVEPLYAVPEASLHPKQFKKFINHLNHCAAGGNPEHCKVSAVFNVSGAGKTKLGYSLAMTGYYNDKFVIVVRLMSDFDIWPEDIITA